MHQLIAAAIIITSVVCLALVFVGVDTSVYTNSSSAAAKEGASSIPTPLGSPK